MCRWALTKNLYPNSSLTMKSFIQFSFFIDFLIFLLSLTIFLHQSSLSIWTRPIFHMDKKRIFPVLTNDKFLAEKNKKKLNFWNIMRNENIAEEFRTSWVLKLLAMGLNFVKIWFLFFPFVVTNEEIVEIDCSGPDGCDGNYTNFFHSLVNLHKPIAERRILLRGLPQMSPSAEGRANSTF